MNKYIIIVIVLGLVILGGVLFKASDKEARSAKDAITAQGQVREFTVTATKEQWEFVPSLIEVNQGDTVKIKFVNEDDFDHGVQIDAFGVSQRIPANSTIDVSFVARNPGDYPFICSVSCGEGMVDGVLRSHFDQTGMIRVLPVTLGE